MAKFEGQERRMPKIEACLAEYGWKTLEDADALCKEHGINVEEIVKGVQPIACDNACWAYTWLLYTSSPLPCRRGGPPRRTTCFLWALALGWACPI